MYPVTGVLQNESIPHTEANASVELPQLLSEGQLHHKHEKEIGRRENEVK